MWQNKMNWPVGPLTRVGVESRYARSDDRSVCVCVCVRERSDITHVLDECAACGEEGGPRNM